MDLQLKDKLALVSGSTAGIGFAIANGLAREGARVIVNGRFVGSLASQGGQNRQQVEKEFFEKARPTSLLKRFATPDEVAAIVIFVCSPLSAATNGAALRVDGGVVRSPF
jgi:NAD(P)-dependent dehydrogenase (short-subunit alcohol dehydrogenase family)